MSNVISFPKPKRDPTRCPRCGWPLPSEVRADREAVKQQQLTLYFDCPGCGTSLFSVVSFDT